MMSARLIRTICREEQDRSLQANFKKTIKPVGDDVLGVPKKPKK